MNDEPQALALLEKVFSTYIGGEIPGNAISGCFLARSSCIPRCNTAFHLRQLASHIEMASSVCCKNGLWSPIAEVRSSRGQLSTRKSSVLFDGNSGAPSGLGTVQGLVWTRKNFSAESWRRKSGRLCRSLDVLQLLDDSGKTDAGKILARLNDSEVTLSQWLSNHSKFNSLEVEDMSVVYGGVTASVAALSALLISPGAANAETLNPAYGEVGALLEAGVQLIYLGALLVLLGVGSFLVVRQVLIKRELETAAKDLQERVRNGDASSLEYFELGAVMLRKKYYQLANKYLDQAIKKWDGSEQDLAQVYNALGFSYFSDGKVEKAIAQYEKAVQLQPGYVIAWNNLADAYENQKEFVKALKAYDQTLQLDPKNKVASARRDSVKTKVDRFQGIP
ncbi:hypothetical protein R1flu_010239 [Riccia fluitans]|uniref:Uncharacterized protein n=1 Tax=Riccia fluitans TaxID=41844 RepID=A0ABD1Z7F8_9MARC